MIKISLSCFALLLVLVSVMPVELGVFTLLFTGEVFGWALFLWRPRWHFVNYMGLLLLSVFLVATIATYGG